MRLLRMIWFRLRALVDRDVVNAELEDELRFHVERETAENIKRGLSAADAWQRAHAAFGGVERFKEEVRDERQVRWLDDISADVKHGLRLLNKNRLFSAAVIGTLALGIGATSTIFAIVNGVLLRPLPYADADRIVSLSEMGDKVDGGQAGQHAFTLWQESTKVFSSMAIYSQSSGVLTGQGEPVQVSGGAASLPFFGVFRAQVKLGRALASEDFVPGAPRVIVLSDELWRTTFGGDASMVNRSIDMNGRQRLVVGVMQPGFDFPERARFWVPLIVPNSPGAEYYFSVVARLNDGVTRESAAADLKRLAPQLDSLRAPGQRNREAVVLTLYERLFGSVQKPLSMLFGAVMVLLLIACANVANLTLARSASRQREFAVRLALGAGRWRLIRQLLVESALLAAIGGALGAILPLVLVGAFVKLSPSSVAGVSDIRIDGTVLAFTAATSVLAALVFGLVPALTGARSGGAGSLSSGGARAGQSRAHRTIRASLVVFEVAAALTLVTGATLLTRSFARAISVSPGFEAQGLYAASISLPSARYSQDAQTVAFYNQVAEQLKATPGIEAVSLSGSRPLGGYSFSRKMSRDETDDAQKIDIAYAEVDGNYGRTVGLRLLAGRWLDPTDVKGTPPVAMITKSAADFFFPGQSAVGHTLPQAKSDTATPQTVVGVIEDVAQRALDMKPVPQVFLASAQHDDNPQVVSIRTAQEPSILRAQVKKVVAGIDPLLPLSEFWVMRDEVAKSVAPRKFNSVLINAFAVLAFVLAIIGLYGLMAHSVATRTRELGIRIALGAQSQNVLQLVMNQGALLLALGVVLGAALSLALSRTVASLLYDTPPQDPLAFVGAPLLLALVGLVACYVPARRATRVNPITALRQD